MKTEEKQVQYQITNSYTTLNELNKHTKNIWIVCHGIGYLSRYFLRYFNELPAEENYIIAPQAQSKYYLNQQYKHVGASWLTKENTAVEMQNVLAYLDTLYRTEKIPQHCKHLNCKLIVFGYSQGVSIATRWVAKSSIPCSHLVLHSGSIPHELTPKDFTRFNAHKTPVSVIVGDADEYLTAGNMELEQEKNGSFVSRQR